MQLSISMYLSGLPVSDNYKYQLQYSRDIKLLSKIAQQILDIWLWLYHIVLNSNSIYNLSDTIDIYTQKPQNPHLMTPF